MTPHRSEDRPSERVAQIGDGGQRKRGEEDERSGRLGIVLPFAALTQNVEGGDAVSASAVKSHIKALIDEEDAKNILSDDQLVDMLKERGFDIARRTVAKYREALGLGSSVQRRRQKKLQGAR